MLSLTGAEISINQLPAGTGVPFVHAHKNNEEIYGIISGKGKALINGGCFLSALPSFFSFEHGLLHLLLYGSLVNFLAPTLVFVDSIW